MDREYASKNIVSPVQEVQAESPKQQQAKVEQTEDEILIRIPRLFFNEHSRTELRKLLTLLTSPLFLPKEGEIIRETYRPLLPKKGRTKIGFFSQQPPYYTGGRYYGFMMATLLAQFADVTMICNHRPPFAGDFKDWGNQVEVIVDEAFGQKVQENEFDIIIGTPFDSADFAYAYAGKWNIPLALMVFETPNFIHAYRGGADGSDALWNPLKGAYMNCDYIICISETSMKYAKEYFAGTKAEFVNIYPCINEPVVNEVFSKAPKEPEGILYSTRAAPFKSPLGLIRALGKRGFKEPIHTIGKIWSTDKKALEEVKKQFPHLDVREHDMITDKEKYEIMRSVKVLAMPSMFEGFGLPPLEVLAFGKDIVAYDLEVLREVYGDRILYVPSGDFKALAVKVMEVCSKKITTSNKINEYRQISTLKDAKAKLLDMFPQISRLSVGLIAYNDEEYIEYALDAIYDLAYEIIIVEGRVKGFPGKSYMSMDNTRVIIKRYIANKDYLGKIKVVWAEKEWESKNEMQNEIAKRISGDIYMKMDADEIWKPEDIRKVLQYFADNTTVDVMSVPFLHFWTNFKTIAKDTGGKWSIFIPRFWRWNPEYKHESSFNYFVDRQGTPVWSPDYTVVPYDEVTCYHFGYVKPLSKINPKLEYYAKRNIEKFVAPKRYEDWCELKDKTQPTQDSPSWAENISVALPEVLTNHPYNGVEDVR